MKKYLQYYLMELEKNIDNKTKYNVEEIKEVERKIQFFQHERLIHLIVTLSFALFTIIFLVFYIKHYFYLENSVQYMYKLYDQIIQNSKI